MGSLRVVDDLIESWSDPQFTRRQSLKVWQTGNKASCLTFLNADRLLPCVARSSRLAHRSGQPST
jgi:hypothetical protein